MAAYIIRSEEILENIRTLLLFGSAIWNPKDPILFIILKYFVILEILESQYVGEGFDPNLQGDSDPRYTLPSPSSHVRKCMKLF